jgi:hypothetical protein
MFRFVIALMLVQAAFAVQAQHRYDAKALKDINTSSREYAAKPFKDGVVFFFYKKSEGF